MNCIFSLEGREFQGTSDDYEEHVVGELGNAFSIAFTACIRDSESWSPFVRLDALHGTDIIMIACHIFSRGGGLPQHNTIRLVRQWLKNKFKGWGI